MRTGLTLVYLVTLITAGCGSSSTGTPDGSTAKDAPVISPDGAGGSDAVAPDAVASSDAVAPDAAAGADAVAPDAASDRSATSGDAVASDGSSPSADGAAPDALPADGGVLPAVQTFDTDQGPLKMTAIQHASVLFEWNGLTIYVDPAMGTFTGRPAADVILISHKHGDHLVPANINLLRKATTKLFGPASVASMPAVTGMTVMNNGDTQSVGALQIQAVPAYNLTADRLMYHPMGDGNGYVLTFGNKKVFVSGDTECVPAIMALTGIDVALLCMNLPYTMSVPEAAACVKTFNPKILYPYHYSGQDPSVVPAMVGASSEVRLLNWYAK
jgi:L-ascorbate metabolism protein UlaG (beta-lactamase superfamily)